MKQLFYILIFLPFICMGQTILVNGSPYLATQNNSFPFWLDAGSTLSTNPPMNFISVVEYNENEIEDDKNLGYSKVLSITESSVVPDGKVWKVISALQYHYEGCTDQLADNYDINANVDDGNCIYLGCTDASACNFDNSSNTDDGSCQFPEQYTDCDGNLFAQVGDMIEGGIVFYVDESNQHGLVSCLVDIGLYQWDLAAPAANEFISQEGYEDWYLPSLDELWNMYHSIGQGSTLGNIGNFNDRYWSSTEVPPNNASSIRFNSGQAYNDGQEASNLVRPIRSF